MKFTAAAFCCLLLASGVLAPQLQVRAHVLPVAAAATFGVVAAVDNGQAVELSQAGSGQSGNRGDAGQAVLAGSPAASGAVPVANSATAVPGVFEPSDEWQEIMPGQHLPGVSLTCVATVLAVCTCACNSLFFFPSAGSCCHVSNRPLPANTLAHSYTHLAPIHAPLRLAGPGHSHGHEHGQEVCQEHFACR